MDYFEKSLEYTPDNFHAVYNAATLLYETNQFELANSWFEGARDCTLKFDERKLANIGLGANLEKLNRNDEAMELYKNEGFATKIEELEKKLKKSGSYEEIRRLETDKMTELTDLDGEAEIAAIE
jgi:tetratricopeptide (TPR) repeat protein